MNNFYHIPIIFIFSFFLLFIGLRVLISKKPIIINSKYLLLIIFVLIVSMLIFPNLDDFSKGEIDYFNTGISILLIIVFFIFMSRYLNGYQLIGMDGESFRKCISHSLNNLGIEYKEDFSKIVIDKYDLTINCTIQSWIGQAQIQFKGRVDKKFIGSLIDEMNKNISSLKILPNKISAYFYTIFGFLALLTSGYYLLKIL